MSNLQNLNMDLEEFDLLIIDDVFPSQVSSFRYAEYLHYLHNFKKIRILVNGSSLPLLHQNSIYEVVAKFNETYPTLKESIIIQEEQNIPIGKCSLAYFCFLNNAYRYLDIIEKEKIPFIFELYPGGGFAIDNEASDNRLRAVFSSPYFRKVITTQDISREYLLKKGFCSSEQIYHIFGVVLPENSFYEMNPDFLINSKRSSNFNISFAAFRYSKKGEDKGFDTFIQIANKLHQSSLNFHFSVVGNFGPDLIELGELKEAIDFLGVLPREKLLQFFSTQHIIISPNKPNLLELGSFDGFPTTCCIEAGLQNTLIMCTDPNNLNRGRFLSGEDIMIISDNVESTVESIKFFEKNRDELIRIVKAQKNKILRLYHPNIQLKEREKLIRAEINYSKATGDNTIPIMHCFDNNYVIPAAVSFYSMLEHANPNYRFKLYVLHTDITWQNQQKLIDLVDQFPNATLEFINMENKFDDIWMNVTNSDHLAKEVLYKLIASSIFPQYDKLIVTDVDVVFLDDISPSYFSFDPSDKIYLAGVKHILPRGSFLENYYKNYVHNFGPESLDDLKVCGGFLVMNLKKLREDQMERKFITYLNENAFRLLQGEQDVLNFCLKQEEIVQLPLNYVVCSYAYDIFDMQPYSTDKHYKASEIQDALGSPIQLHYATHIKPWNTAQCTKAEKWFTYLAKTNFFEDYVNQTLAKKREPQALLRSELFWENGGSHETSVDISVLCCTYNHERFIRATLDGIVNQVTTASFEIIIADDASTDNTQSIIREYRDRYPDLFKKCILRTQNVGIGENYYEALSQVAGKYLAICDGDDCWIDPNKLQRQSDFLNEHPEYTICCSSFVTHHVADSQKKDTIFYVNDYINSAWKLKKDGYTFEDLLNCRFIASCTTMLRWKLNGRVPEFIKQYPIIDFPLALIHSAFGKIHVMNDYVMSQYNVHSGGISSSCGGDVQSNIIREVNQLLDFRFSKNVDDYFGRLNSLKKSVQQKVNECPHEVSVASDEENGLTTAPKSRGFRGFYRAWMPPVLQRLVRLIPRVIKVIYHECVPMRVQEFYTYKIKPRLKRPV